MDNGHCGGYGSTGDELRLERILFQRLSSFRFGTTTYVQTTVYQWNGFGSAADEMGCPLPSAHCPARCENISSIGFPIGAATVVSPTAEEEELGSCSACTTSIQPRHLIETEIFDRNRNNKTHQLAI